MPAPTGRGAAHVVRADARALPLPDQSVDLIVTSPPYYALRSYQDGGEHYAGQIGSEPTPGEFVDALLEVTRECMRVLKPTGSLFVNLGDKYVARSAGLAPATGQIDTARTGARDANPRRPPAYKVAREGWRPGAMRDKSLMGLPWRYAIRCMDDLGLILRAEVVWSKTNGLPESVTDRVRRAHEQWFHFTLEPRYFSTIDEIREPYSPASLTRIAAGFNPTKRDVVEAERNGALRARAAGEAIDGYITNPLGKMPGSVWAVPSESLVVPEHLGVDHFAAFPSEWPRRLILGWCPPDGVVLDPFGGTGTTAMVAKALGRTGVSVDMSLDYCRIAQWRTSDRDQLAKVLGVPKAPPTGGHDTDGIDLLSLLEAP
jgi:site-specific DNA-methyltransferase (cytosine-N4-specific)